jgi:glycosyltransferase involved in cell wall biosynthesis
MRIAVVTDTWFPRVSGVVRTLDTLRVRLEALGHQTLWITPGTFPTLPCPSYPQVRLAMTRPAAIGRRIQDFRPDAVHIATEGPLGWAARSWCLSRGYPFTTAFHTRSPEYLHVHWRIPLNVTYGMLRRFHRASSGLMVATQTLEDELKGRGFTAIRRWTLGVDTALFRPRMKTLLPFKRPIALFVGRIAVEKNIEDFLRLPLDGTKVVIGEGPQRAELESKYPEVRFLGKKLGEDLAEHYAAADVFVFPSRTDTFGLVLLEAMASGVPVAAYPVPGPLDVVDQSGAGVLDDDLGAAIHAALAIPPARCRAHAESFSWDRSVDQFLGSLPLIS